MNLEKDMFKRGNPEAKIQKEIIRFLQLRYWIVKSTHGSLYQSGFPDLYATHEKFGPRWIEVKLPNFKGSRWTAAQRKSFPELASNGTKIWILTGATESEYKKLFRPPNWFEVFAMHG